MGWRILWFDSRCLSLTEANDGSMLRWDFVGISTFCYEFNEIVVTEPPASSIIITISTPAHDDRQSPHLRPVFAMPETKLFWQKAKRITAGKTVTTAAAITKFQGVP